MINHFCVNFLFIYKLVNYFISQHLENLSLDFLEKEQFNSYDNLKGGMIVICLKVGS